MPPPKRPSARPKRTSLPREEEPPYIPPPPPTRPEGLGVILEPGVPETGSSEDYYKRIHAHRTVLAMHAVRPNAKPEAVIVDDDREPASAAAQLLLARVFAAEREATDLRERLSEACHERDAARGEVVLLKERIRLLRVALDAP